MSIVKHRSKSGVTYVYESESYWDKEKQQPRSRRKLIGKIDEKTGETVPTGPRGRRKMTGETSTAEAVVSPIAAAAPDVEQHYIQMIKEKDITIHQQEAEIIRLQQEKAMMLNKLEALVQLLKSPGN